MLVIPPLNRSAAAPSYWNFTTIEFNRSIAYPTKPEYWGAYPNDIQVFDINGDGHLDILQVYSFIPPLDLPGVPIRILLGDGRGNFTDGTASLLGTTVPLSDAASGLSVADFNGDGVKDVFIGRGWETPQPKDAQNTLLLSNGRGGVVNATANLPNINDYTHWSTFGDIDGDGDNDIFVTNIGGAANSPVGDTSSYFLINDGRGNFTRDDTRLPTAIESGAKQYTSSLLFDADGDGDQDLFLGMWGPQAALQNSGAFSSLILFNNGSGRFAETARSELPAPPFDRTRAEVLDTKAIDLDGDKDLDLLVITHNQQIRTIQVLINQGNGRFVDDTAARLNASESNAIYTGRYLHLIDVNGDGAKDIVLQTGGPNRFYLNDGTGHFVSLPGDFIFTNSPDGNYAFVPGDFNEDGSTDFFVRTIVNNWDDPNNFVEFDWIALWSPPAGNVHTGDETANALLGGRAAENLIALGGDDVIFGGAGDDMLEGGSGDDYLHGGEGRDTAVFTQSLAQSTIVRLSASSLSVIGPNGTDKLVSIEQLRFGDGLVQLVDGSPLVDDLYYMQRFLDVFRAGIDPDAHYSAYGWREGRDPNALFSTTGYLAANLDVKAANIDPLAHYDSSGWREGRDPSAKFDTSLYLIHNPDVASAKIDPLRHFLEYGRDEGRSSYDSIGSKIRPDGFDAEYYLLANVDVAAAGVDPYQHFITYGWKEGRNPNSWFDVKGYLKAYPDVAAANVNPLEHYHLAGWKEGRDPSANFDTSEYLRVYADIAAAGIDPLVHYLQYGAYELRNTFSDGVIG